MKRKLVKQGVATMMISLPSKWIKANSLNKGDEIDIEEKGKSLIIEPEKRKSEKKEILIKIGEENKQDIKTILTHAYRKGFDKITLEDINPGLLKEIRIASNSLLGFELTEKDSKKCVVENISEPLEQKYEIILKKIFLIIKETQEITSNDFEKEKFNLNEIEETKNQQDRFILFCRRLLIKQPSDSALLEWELLTFLMHIQHTYYYLYKYVSENKIKIDKEMIRLLNQLKEYFSLFENSYYNKNISTIHKINNLKKDYHFGKCIELIEKSKAKEAVVYSYIRELFRLIQIGTSPILGMILEEKI
jgi:phosphate uptake regulator